jgi:superfamily II DNA or RNA helicase
VPELVQVTAGSYGSVKYRTYLLGNRQALLNIIGMKASVRELLGGFTLEQQIASGGLAPTPEKQLEALLHANAEQVKLLHGHYYKHLKQLQPFLGNDLDLLCCWNKEIGVTHNYKKISLSQYTPYLTFKVWQTDKLVSLECLIKINHVLFKAANFEKKQFFLRDRGEVFMMQPGDAEKLGQMQQKILTVHRKQKQKFLEQVVYPLKADYEVDDSAVAETVALNATPVPMIRLSELSGDFLVITPYWKYDWYETEDVWVNELLTIQKDHINYTIRRDILVENAFRERLKMMHPDFERQNKEYFYLKTSEAQKKGWFYHFYNELLAEGVSITGAERLKQFKYNAHKAEVKVTASGAIDWFDVLVEVSFGDYMVPLADLRNALLNKQQHILLKDGTLGILPLGFDEQYGLLLKMGQVEKNKLKVSKYHWGILDELKNLDSNEVLQKRFSDTRILLQQTDFDRRYPVPQNITAKLRNYQVAGFRWLCLLQELQWGACLADDMGLGKTLQTITFLQYLINGKNNFNYLVVCPTSLIFNWQKELEKFAPGISFHVYYGNDRVLNKTVLKKHAVIITSYGNMRSDIELLQQINFGCVVLDESHAIKNPASLTAHAAMQLQCHHRIALSGTPVQNNTYDLYAQMQFMNPGLLGSREFFKQQFATPIDKLGDEAAGRQLQKMVYPFMLRRTKEQVAKDLPDKTETILWCEMEFEQREIYESIKNHYRESLLGKIDHDGMGKSNIAILEGLTRLRQVCNSPALIKGDTPYPDASIKKEELVREIEDNIGQHKALVFSQFTSMLSLIAQELEERDINYIYLDGGTPASERQTLVENFQTDNSIRVFLISLKAGGVGLNLTAADYVYLVDPWWNPAAEAQAIDRTHRIGQTRKVFAYKMICRDTVEEKILQLQARKKELSEALVAEEGGFVKKLTRDDVAFLFS